jgi:16S rRNA (uracil1498-N3)-methyltransferase
VGGTNGVNLTDLATGNRFILDSLRNEAFVSLVHQWKDVFRYMPGSRVVLFDDSGVECLCMIESYGSFKTELVILEKTDESMKGVDEEDKLDSSINKNSISLAEVSSHTKSAKNNEVWLFISILKGENFDLVVQKVTELGANHIVPVLCDRTIKKNINQKRVEKIAIEASEQSGRTSVLKIHEPVTLKKAVEDFLAIDGDMAVCHQRGDSWEESKKLLKKYPLGFLVGPEGGWSEKEEKYFEKMALRKIKFSNNVLRAETAAIGVVTLVKVINL